MIHFDVTETDGDRTLYLEGTGVLVGWIEKGRTRQTQHGRKVEWRFTPNSPTAQAGKVSTNGIAQAYADARAFAETL